MSEPKACTCDAISLRMGLAEVNGTKVHKTFCQSYTPAATELEAAQRTIAQLRVELIAKTDECHKAQNMLIAIHGVLRGAV